MRLPASIILFLVFNVHFSSAQKLEELKKKSSDHSRGSESPSGNSKSDNNNLKESSDDSYCTELCAGACCNSLAEIDWHGLFGKSDHKTKQNVFETLHLNLNGSFVPSNYHFWVVQIAGNSRARYSYALRYLVIQEQRVDFTESYSTLDIQPLQLQLVNRENLFAKFGIGVMLEEFDNSSKGAFEITSNMNWRLKNHRIDIGLEGRTAHSNGVVRQEASFETNYAIWQNEKRQFLIGLQARISEYYQSVDFYTIGASTGFRF